jgi:methyl-accepting chemotaxis protein
MRNLRVWQKLAVMGAVFLLPFAVVIYKTADAIYTLGIENARQGLRGLEYYNPALLLIQHLQKHRDLAAGWLSGAASFKEPLDRKTVEIESELKKLDEVDRRLGAALRTTSGWAAVSAACRDLLERTPVLSPQGSFDLHSQVIADVVALIAYVGDASNLSRDPDIDGYYLMNVLIHQGPELSEVLGQTRAVGSGMTASKQGTPEQYAVLNRLCAVVEYRQRTVDELLSKVFEVDAALSSALKANTAISANAVHETLGYVRNVIASPLSATSPEDYVSKLTSGIDSIFEMEHQIARTAHILLKERIAKLERQVQYTLEWTALGLLLAAAIGIVITRDLTVSLREAVSVSNQIASGDLAVRITSASRKDEFGGLARAFHRMMTTLSSLIGEVQRSGIQVTSCVHEISATSQEQGATADQIAATATGIGATSQEISATSQELVETMNEVSAVAEQTALLAGSGQTSVSRMRESMHRVMGAVRSTQAKLAVLDEKAGNISQVVTTITEVADQTNLLSLNAAMEAEKAGANGRGFSVVATEIRRLADQTAVATYDIEQMVKEIQSAVSPCVMGMNKFSEQVGQGRQRVGQLSDQLSQIIQQAQALAPRFEAVNEGMQAQATGAEHISRALLQLSEATRQTVESLRQSSQSIDGLRHAAEGLRSGVSRFTLAETSLQR